jgi:copper chaperone CopZ
LIAKIKKGRKLTNLPILGSLVLAIMAHICCIAPIVMALLGVGGGSLFSKFANLRPYLMGMTGFFLGLAFYLTYKKREVRCEDGTSKIRRVPKWNKISLWIATILVVFFMAFPHLIGSLNTSSGRDQMKGEISEVTITVKGMTGSGCEFNIEKAVKKLDGIIMVKADYKKGKVNIKYEKGKVNVDDMEEAINKSGYKVIKQ